MISVNYADHSFCRPSLSKLRALAWILPGSFIEGVFGDTRLSQTADYHRYDRFCIVPGQNPTLFSILQTLCDKPQDHDLLVSDILIDYHSTAEEQSS
jgi:hypothetical protein